MVDQEEKTVEINEGQAGSNPGKTPESRPPPDDKKLDEDQAGPDLGKSRMDLAGPNPEPTNEDFMANIYPNVHESLKFPTDEHVILEDPLSSSRTLSSMKNLDLYTFATTTTPLPLPPLPQQRSSSDPNIASRVSELEQVCANFEKRHKLQEKLF
ncbi:hypothetical protein Tco_0197954, partial [Tanacetum coccineum]